MFSYTNSQVPIPRQFLSIGHIIADNSNIRSYLLHTYMLAGNRLGLS